MSDGAEGAEARAKRGECEGLGTGFGGLKGFGLCVQYDDVCVRKIELLFTLNKCGKYSFFATLPIASSQISSIHLLPNTHPTLLLLFPPHLSRPIVNPILPGKHTLVIQQPRPQHIILVLADPTIVAMTTQSPKHASPLPRHNLGIKFPRRRPH